MKKNAGKVIYLIDEDSFDFLPPFSADFSFLIGYVNLTFDAEKKKARQIWGLNPRITWISKELTPPKSMEGGLLVRRLLESGETERMIEVGSWKTYFDHSNGWVCIGCPGCTNVDQAVEFAENTIAVVSATKLKALWLKPSFI